MSPGKAFDFDIAVRLIQASDDRRGRSAGAGGGTLDRTSLERFAQALAFVAAETPHWIESITYAGPSGAVETEVRALGVDALYVVTTPWVIGEEPGFEPTVRIRPLSALTALEVDGFENDEDGRPIGCTITLIFDGGTTVRLGSSDGADRTRLVRLLPALLRRVGA